MRGKLRSLPRPGRFLEPAPFASVANSFSCGSLGHHRRAREATPRASHDTVRSSGSLGSSKWPLATSDRTVVVSTLASWPRSLAPRPPEAG